MIRIAAVFLSIVAILLSGAVCFRPPLQQPPRANSHYTTFEVVSHGDGLIYYDTLVANTANAECYGTAGCNVLWVRALGEAR